MYTYAYNIEQKCLHTYRYYGCNHIDSIYIYRWCNYFHYISVLYNHINTPVHYNAMLIHDLPPVTFCPGLLQNLRWGPPWQADVATKLASQVEKEGPRHRDEARSCSQLPFSMKFMVSWSEWNSVGVGFAYVCFFFSPCIWKKYLYRWTRKNHVTRYVLYLALTIGYFDFQSTTDPRLSAGYRCSESET